MRVTLRLVCLTTFAALVVPATAAATFPGENGRIVFRCDGICSTDPGGTVVTQLTDGRHYEEGPSYSADGRLIAFSRRYPPRGGENERYEVMVMRADGSGLRRVTRSPSEVFNFVQDFTPDGERIVFNRSGRGIEAGIYIMDVDGSDMTRLGAGFGPQVSPDGTKIVFTRGKTDPLGYPQLYTMDIDGSNVTPLTSADPDVSAQDPEWAPDGQRILMTYFELNAGTPDPSVQGIFTIRPDGSDLTRLSSPAPPTSDGDGWIREATFSPDGELFAAGINDRCDADDCYDSLYVMDVGDGSYQPRLFGVEPGFEPDWGPAIEGGPAPEAWCHGQEATIVGSIRDDVISATPEPDVIAARAGADRVERVGEGDLVCGGAGGDLLRGGAGDDNLDGQDGNDRLVGFDGRDTLSGRSGDDVLSGGPRRDLCRGGPGEDVLRQCEV